jgi:hypothetical protein
VSRVLYKYCSYVLSGEQGTLEVLLLCAGYQENVLFLSTVLKHAAGSTKDFRHSSIIECEVADECSVMEGEWRSPEQCSEGLKC